MKGKRGKKKGGRRKGEEAKRERLVVEKERESERAQRSLRRDLEFSERERERERYWFRWRVDCSVLVFVLVQDSFGHVVGEGGVVGCLHCVRVSSICLVVRKGGVSCGGGPPCREGPSLDSILVLIIIYTIVVVLCLYSQSPGEEG